MKTAFMDCFSGISGDMCLGALLDCGIEIESFEGALRTLPVSGWQLSAKRVNRRGVAAIKVSIDVTEEQPCRTLGEISAAIKGGDLPDVVKERSLEVFRRLVEAEAKVHGTDVSRTHLHEAGAVDAIIDVVGTVLGLHVLGIERIYLSPLPLGGGTVKCAHGLLPVPAPAAAELMRGIPTVPGHTQTELVTPTGAALAVTLAASFGTPPAMTIEHIGYGAGTKDLSIPNVLRILIGTAEAPPRESAADVVEVVETTIDDMNPEIFSSLGPNLLTAGALDFFITPVQMKKNRPGVLLTAICPQGFAQEVACLILHQTSSLGCRIRTETRRKTPWEIITVTTPFGPVDVKFSRETGTVSPEYAQCEKHAAKHDVPVKIVYDRAKAEAVTLLLGEKT